MPPTPNPIEIYYPNGGVLGVQMYVFDTVTNEPTPWDGASVFSGTISIGSISGTKGNNTATPGTNNIGVIGAVCVTTNTAYTDGNLVLPTVTPEGLLRVDAAVTFPASMTVSGTVSITGSVTIANTTVNVANFPAVQAVSGTVSITGSVTVANTAFNVTVSNTTFSFANTAINATISNTTFNVGNPVTSVNATVSNTSVFLAGAPLIFTTQVTVTTGSSTIVASRATRRSLMLQNLGATQVHFAHTTATTTNSGILTGTTGSFIVLPTVAQIFGIVGSGSQAISITEVYD